MKSSKLFLYIFLGLSGLAATLFLGAEYSIVQTDTIPSAYYDPNAEVEPNNKMELTSSSYIVFKNYVWPLLLFGIMIVGMFSNQAFEMLLKRKNNGGQTVNIKSIFKKSLSGISFWMGFLVSPLIFFATYFMLKEHLSSAVACIYAYQNGFFWHNIFDKSISGNNGTE